MVIDTRVKESDRFGQAQHQKSEGGIAGDNEIYTSVEGAITTGDAIRIVTMDAIRLYLVVARHTILEIQPCAGCRPKPPVREGSASS